MKVGKRTLSVLMIFFVVFAMLPIQAFAAGKIQPDQNATLIITYKDYEKPIPNAEFRVYKVADVDEYARMSLTTQFERYKYTVASLSALDKMDHDKWLDLASTLKGYVQRDKLFSAANGKTDQDGLLSLNVKPGLYLVVGYRATTEDYYTYSATPFMVFIPGEDIQNNEWNYVLNVSPKYEKDYFPPDVPDTVVTRKVLKLWDDSGYEEIRPEEVTVQLLCEGMVFDTVILNESNNWRYAWDNLDSQHEWTVVEKELPDYAVTIAQKGITYTLSNKYIVPVTESNPPVQKRVTGDTPQTASTFTFVLTAEKSSFPMPEGSNGTTKEITIKGAGSAEFGDITFTKPGTYVYKVTEKNTEVIGYTYDESVFTITYTVTQENGELITERTISDSNANTVSTVEFTNIYKTPGNKIPQTGIMWWPVPVLLFAGLAFLMIGVIRRRRCN